MHEIKSRAVGYFASTPGSVIFMMKRMEIIVFFIVTMRVIVIMVDM